MVNTVFEIAGLSKAFIFSLEKYPSVENSRYQKINFNRFHVWEKSTLVLDVLFLTQEINSQYLRFFSYTEENLSSKCVLYYTGKTTPGSQIFFNVQGRQPQFPRRFRSRLYFFLYREDVRS